jgi:hypothetical protein
LNKKLTKEKEEIFFNIGIIRLNSVDIKYFRGKKGIYSFLELINIIKGETHTLKQFFFYFKNPKIRGENKL